MVSRSAVVAGVASLTVLVVLSVVLLLVLEEAVAAFNSSEHPVKVKEELMASCCFPLAAAQ